MYVSGNSLEDFAKEPLESELIVQSRYEACKLAEKFYYSKNPDVGVSSYSTETKCYNPGYKNMHTIETKRDFASLHPVTCF